MANILILYSSFEGQTKKMAEAIKQVLEPTHRVILADMEDGPSFPTVDGVIVGASIHANHYPKFVKDYLWGNLDLIKAVPNAFFSVCLSAADDDLSSRQRTDNYVQTLLEELSWRPDLTASFAGALRYSSYGLLKKHIMRNIAQKTGKPTEMSQDYEYTDWEDVGRFATNFAMKLLQMRLVMA